MHVPDVYDFKLRAETLRALWVDVAGHVKEASAVITWHSVPAHFIK
jgi:hypothetical protein